MTIVNHLITTTVVTTQIEAIQFLKTVNNKAFDQIEMCCDRNCFVFHYASFFTVLLRL
jgi:hypothetical protein